MTGQDRKTEVEIGGERYLLRSDDPAEHLHKVAVYVDSKLRDLRCQSPALNPSRAAVLVALTLADELLKHRATTDRQAGDTLARINDILRLLEADASRPDGGRPAVQA